MINDACHTLCDNTSIHVAMLRYISDCMVLQKKAYVFAWTASLVSPARGPRPSWLRLVIQTRRRFGAVLMPLQQYQRHRERGNLLEFWVVRHWKTVLQLNSNIHLKKAIFLVGLLVNFKMDEIWCVSKEVWSPEDFFFEKWCLEKSQRFLSFTNILNQQNNLGWKSSSTPRRWFFSLIFVTSRRKLSGHNKQ